jgi:hypothetical protein
MQIARRVYGEATALAGHFSDKLTVRREHRNQLPANIANIQSAATINFELIDLQKFARLTTITADFYQLAAIGQRKLANHALGGIGYPDGFGISRRASYQSEIF